MGKVLARLIVVSFCVAAYADESWFDGHWILDREATLAAWAKATEAMIARNVEHPEPGFEGLSAEAIRARFERSRHAMEKVSAKLWDTQGLPEMEVDSGSILSRWPPNSVYGPEAYFLRPIEPGVFEMVANPEGEQGKCVIRKTKTGFCQTECGPYGESPRPENPYAQECFKRHGA